MWPKRIRRPSSSSWHATIITWRKFNSTGESLMLLVQQTQYLDFLRCRFSFTSSIFDNPRERAPGADLESKRAWQSFAVKDTVITLGRSVASVISTASNVVELLLQRGILRSFRAPLASLWWNWPKVTTVGADNNSKARSYFGIDEERVYNSLIAVLLVFFVLRFFWDWLGLASIRDGVSSTSTCYAFHWP